jgi:hypothetical protein
MISQLSSKPKLSVKGASGKKFFGKNGEILLCAMPRLPVVYCACRPPEALEESPLRFDGA